MPNAVDLARFSTDVAPNGVRSELGIDAHAPIVGTIARLAEYRKGIHRFLEMAQLVRGVRPDTRFLVVGDGPLRPELELQADQLGIRDSIVFAGERRDVPRLLAAMQVFVMPSLSESGPITVLEALSMGTPVVSTRVGIVPTVIVDRVDGRLTDPGDSAELASAVLELLSDQVTAGRLGLAGREVVHARFGPDALVDGVAEIYREVA